jgi:hypothetical protein
LCGFAAAVEDEDFNRFDAPLCDLPLDCLLLGDLADALPDILPDILADVLAADGRLPLAPVLDAFDDFAAVRRGGGVLGDFLRDFLDIRLPFVAFGGSIIRVLRVISGKPDSLPWLGKFDGLGVWLQGIRRAACPLVG